MALGATVHRFEIDVSDVDRGLYTQLDVRVARHPSESLGYLVTRTLGYALAYEEGLVFCKGISTADEPAAWVRDESSGRIALWLDVGAPSAERLHKASKAADRVVVFTHHDPRLLIREARSRPIYAAERIEVYALAPALVEALESLIDRHTTMQLLRTAGVLYVTVGDRTIEGAVATVSLA